MVWQWVLRGWVQQRAREAVTSELFRAAAPTAGQLPGPTAACHVAVIAALGTELGCFQDRLSHRVTAKAEGFTLCAGRFEGRNVILVQTGVGQENAARVTNAIIDAHKPWWVISAGFAGSLSEAVQRNDLVIAREVVASGREVIPLAPYLRPPAVEHLGQIHRGRLATVDYIVRTPAAKRRLGQESEAIAVDMETYAVAEVCRQRKVSYLSLRVISDGVDDALPREIDRVLKRKTTAGKFGAVVGSLFERPGSIKDFYRLKEQSLIAADRLADLLAAALPELVPVDDSPQDTAHSGQQEET